LTGDAKTNAEYEVIVMSSDFLLDVQAQPDLLEAALRAHLVVGSALDNAARAIREAAPRRIVITGMGSSFYSAYLATLRLFAAGYPVMHVELSELLHFGSAALTRDTVLIVISQSGETIEAVRLLNDRQPQAMLVAITNNPQGTLAKAAQHVIPHMAGAERAVATKTYTTSLLALTILARRIVGEAPATIADQLLPAIAAQRTLLRDFNPDTLPAEWRQAGPITFVGRGPSYATALAGSLLFKETARIAADALSSAQFRHGPLEIAGVGHRAVICAGPGSTFAHDLRLADELHACGSDVWFIGPISASRRYPTVTLPTLAFAPLAEIIPLQLAARTLAMARGLTPGEFARIGKVTDSE